MSEPENGAADIDKRQYMSGRKIETGKAPLPIGPYSQAIECGDLLFVSGQIPLDPFTGAVDGTTVEQQSRRAIGNLLAILQSRGLSAESLVKTTVFLRNIGNFAAFNVIYESMLCGARPARSVVAVAGLPKNVLVEIEAIACR